MSATVVGMNDKYSCLHCGADTVSGGTLCVDCAHHQKMRKAGAAGIASTTRGRKTRFKDRKKDGDRKACRRWRTDE